MSANSSHSHGNSKSAISRRCASSTWKDLHIDRVFVPRHQSGISKRRHILKSRFRIASPVPTKEGTPTREESRGKFTGWIEPSQNSLISEFFSQTSLHGLRYIAQPKRHLTERLFWAISFFVGLGLSIWLISDVWKKFNESPIIVTFGSFEIPVDEIPFPAITVCNMNKVLRTKAKEYINEASDDTNPLENEALKTVFYLNHVCSQSNSFSKIFNFSVNRGAVNSSLIQKLTDLDKSETGKQFKGFFRNSSQLCTDMIPLCVWRDNVRSCYELFRHLETDLGKCCTFNMIPQKLLLKYRRTHYSPPLKNEEILWKNSNLNVEDLIPKTQFERDNLSQRPRRALSAGRTFGLSFMLRPDIDQYFCTTSDSMGFRLVTHLPISMPSVIDLGLALKPNAEIFIKIRPDLTLVDENIRPIPMEKRNCYLKGEYNLKYYRYYTRLNCIDECITDWTFRSCQCVRYFMPNDGNRDLCGPAKLPCLERIRTSFLNSDVKKYCSHCLRTCTEIEYTTETTVTPLQNGSNLWETLGGKNDFLLNRNASIVHIFFGEHAFYPKIRKELYGITDLMANGGGLLGLCLGFSGLSAVELLYFLTLKAWCRSRRQRRILAQIGQRLRNIWSKIKANQVGPRSNDEPN